MRFNRLPVGRALRNSCTGREPSASQHGHVLEVGFPETGFSPDSQFPTIPFRRTYPTALDLGTNSDRA